MEKEKLNVFLQMATGFLIIVISNIGFWHSSETLGLMGSISIGAAGFLLATSKALVLYEVYSFKDPLFLATVGFFILLIFTFTPMWCYEIVNAAEGWKTCSYVNFWEFYFYPK
jgi:hypothetical protein